MNNYYETEYEAITGLRKKGYEYDFNLLTNRLYCLQTGENLFPDEFEVVETYRFEGATDPGDESVVFAIQSFDGKIKGILISAFGAYADAESDAMLAKLK